jgi:transposase-like protein
MPWRRVCPRDVKMRLVAAVLGDEHSMSELCESFGISRKTAYKWWAHYKAHGSQGPLELSRAPHRVRRAIAQLQAEAIVATADLLPMLPVYCVTDPAGLNPVAASPSLAGGRGPYMTK